MNMPFRPSLRSLAAVIALFAFLYSGVTNARLRSSAQISSRHGLTLPHALGEVEPENDCHLVDLATDKCSYVRQHCADEEPGLISYLQFFYCSMAGAKPLALMLMVAWLSVLFSTIGIAASDFFTPNLSTIASILGLSDSMAGVTFLALGNGSPDVFSTFAAMNSNSGSLAVGELLGAAAFIAGVVAGSMALVQPFEVPRLPFVRDVGFLLVAACFSIGFVADGALQTWECVIMILFYVLYVLIVVLGHWTSTYRQKRRDRHARMRDEFLLSGAPEFHDAEDDLEDVADNAGRRNINQAPSDNSTYSLQTQGPTTSTPPRTPHPPELQEYAAEIRRNLRIRRLSSSSSQTPFRYRPSLVAALEFRPVMGSLQRSRSHQNMLVSTETSSGLLAAPSPLSPTPSWDPSHERVGSSRASRSGSANETLRPGPLTSPRRVRATSANAAVGYRMQEPLSRSQLIHVDGIADSPDGVNSTSAANGLLESRPDGSHHNGLGIQNPAAETSFAAADLLDARQAPKSLSPSPTFLITPPTSATSSRQPTGLAEVLPTTQESSIRSVVGPFVARLLPADLVSTLFPTLVSWGDKTVLQKVVAVAAIPSVFLLTITLPVYEIDRSPETQDSTLSSPLEGSARSTDDLTRKAQQTPEQSRHLTPSDSHQTGAHHEEDQRDLIPAVRVEGPSVQNSPKTPSDQRIESANGAIMTSIETDVLVSEIEPADRSWHRWLVCTQILVGPQLVNFLVWGNLEQAIASRNFLVSAMSTLIVSLLAIVIILCTTSSVTPPRHQVLLCFVGFIVSVAWISTIAGEVVGVLKALGVILQISDAILGLTIFAVGNSFGDLVANITVARLGMPIMAFSACFGGPLLNILLGIGVSGLVMTLKGTKQQNPHAVTLRLLRQAYRIDVGKTLVISAISLVVILCVLLVIVPLNGCVMTRRIGWSLIAIWIVSTAINVGVEVAGESDLA